MILLIGPQLGQHVGIELGQCVEYYQQRVADIGPIHENINHLLAQCWINVLKLIIGWPNVGYVSFCILVQHWLDTMCRFFIAGGGGLSFFFYLSDR